MRLNGRQSPDKIKEHIKELFRGLNNSKKPEIVEDFIDYWTLEYIFKTHKQKQLNK